MPSILNATTTNGLVTSADNSGSLQLQTNNGTTAVTIDTSQNVGIGTSSPTQKLSVNGSVTSTGRFIPLNGSTILGYVGDDNTVSGGTGSNIGIRSDTAMLFATGGATERMRITSGGDIGFNTNSPATSNGNVGRIYAFNGESNNCIITGTSSTAERNLLLEYRRTGRSSVRTAQINIGENVSNQGRVECYSSAANADLSGGVTLANGATSWSAISDENKKDIIEPITDGLNKVASLRSVIGKYKTDEQGIRRSFLIAQDVQAVLPEAVSTINDINGDEALGLSYTDVIPLLVAAIQELKAELDTVKAELNTLKNPPVEGTE